MRNKNKKNRYILLLLILVGSIGLGYAFLTQDLLINGISIVKGNNWKIYFDNVVVSENSITLSDDDHEPVINPTTKTDIEFTITLNQPGDFYEFTVDVINEGSIDAMIDLISNKLNGEEIDTENPLPNYLKYTVTYGDGVALEKYQLLEHSSTDKYKIRVEYNKDITGEDLPADMQSVTLNFRVNYVQSDDHAVVRHLGSFETDSWETIIDNVQNGKYYEVGATKEVELGNDLGTHILRVANNTNPEECQNGCVSQTACGFVLEFADIITTHRMNPNASGNTEGTGNIGSWPATEMRTYLNDENNPTSIINSLPTILKNAIIDTPVTSGNTCKTYHSTDLGRCCDYTKNYKSIDKLYLLSTHEVWNDLSNSWSRMTAYDTTYNYTRQLDYYYNNNVKIELVTTPYTYTDYINREIVQKKYNNSNAQWWLRSAYSGSNNYYYNINTYAIRYDTSENAYGISPAFRLAGPQQTTANDKCNSFETDSWEKIISKVKSGNIPSYYKVGDRKEIELGNGLGTHVLRIANTSTPTECLTEGFSQTGCGFVLEFDDVISKHRMNPYEPNLNGQGNVGGWEYSEMRSYLNDENDSSSIYNSLPNILKNAIIDTTVISGHGKADNNFTTKDKLYLLSLHEVWEDDDGDISSGVNARDTTYNNSRQLDFYASYGLTSTKSNTNISNKVFAESGSYNSMSFLWMRTPNKDNKEHFYINYGTSAMSDSTNYGVSPAFRLAGPESTYVPACQAFENDSWDTIIANAKSNNYSKYNVGCEKPITLGNDYGEQIIRIANNTTPSECSAEDFSQTACGFVLEFETIIAKNAMNSTYTNVGGWPASSLRTTLNDANDPTSIINSLPNNIKNAIINTKVVSGHGSTEGETNFVSTDKLYLLAPVEVYGESATRDTTIGQTRQLDFYENLSVSTSNYFWGIKLYNGSLSYWWLRSAHPTTSSYNENTSFFSADSSGYLLDSSASGYLGVAPAFRLG